MKRDKAAEGFAARFLTSIGYDNALPEHRETARRITDLYRDMMSGITIDLRKFFERPLPSEHGELTVLKNIEFISLCEHHLWPFFGKVHIAYIPKGRIVGLSKFISAVRAEARRPQLQERMVRELADVIDEMLQPLGCMVIVDAQHTCMMVGGRYDYGMPAHTDAETIMSAVRGVFLNFEPPRNEALNLIFGGGKK